MAKKEEIIENNDDKTEQLLNEAIKQIEKQYGKGSIMRLGEHANVDVDAISTGSLAIDYALGVGGLPRGRIIEIYGPESSGKTTLALQCIAECQKEGGKAAFIDAEHAIDPRYAKALGVDVDELILSQPDSGEQALEIAEVLIKSGAIDLIVIDSVAALVPQAELDGEMGDSNIGLHARLMSKAMRKLAGAMNLNNCTTIFINQLREKVGVMFGNPEVTTGGRALKFYATIRLEVRKSEAIKDGTEIIGNKVNVKIAKNKVAPPFKTCQVEIYYGQGISHVAEIISMGVDMGIIEKSGSWYSYKGEKIGQGTDAVKAYLTANLEIDKEITEQIKTQMFKKDETEA
jgi:recombination protein RecA